MEWEEHWVSFMLDNWQEGKSYQEISELMTHKYRIRFTKSQIGGMIKRLRDRFGTEDVDGERNG